ncbi:MAG: 4-hydroxy-tetrahydrodipicolinate synthase [Desulfobacterota bacterium]|nr:4-hydroxy-tetrahydrodipicolinate synthase [Thermodesulfobacteriota bacterium]
MLRGSMVALVTPFKNGVVDEAALAELVEFQIINGTNVICPCGTTGESATLSFEEHERVVEIVIRAAAGRVPVMAGTGSNNTDEAIRLTRHAQKAGADACLLITPYYNRPTQEGLYLHFKKIAEQVDIPLVLYNVPSRTGVNMLPETVERLAQIKNIVGIKEASGMLSQISEIVRRCGSEFSVLSGDDVNTLPLMAVGGKGVISVTANIAPRDIAAMVHAAQNGQYDEARRLHLHLLPLHDAMFLQTNPIPVKTALGLMGKISPELRLPLSPMPEELIQKLRSVLRQYALVE